MTYSDKEWRIEVVKEMKTMILNRQPNDTLPIRYKRSTAHILSMINRIIMEDMDVDKIDRWTGYIQGVMCCRGFATVDEFRELVRTHRPKKQPTVYHKLKQWISSKI